MERWPSFEEVQGILEELAAGLLGAAPQTSQAFRIENRGLLESALGLPHHAYYGGFFPRLAALVRSIAANQHLSTATSVSPSPSCTRRWS